MSLASIISDEIKQGRERALAQYRSLATKGKPDAAERAELIEAMRVLNKSPVDLERDLAALATYNRHQKIIEDANSEQTRAATVAAMQALNDHRAESDRILKERQQEQNQLAYALNLLQQKTPAAHDAAGICRQLKHQFAEFLGFECQPPLEGGRVPDPRAGSYAQKEAMMAIEAQVAALGA